MSLVHKWIQTLIWKWDGWLQPTVSLCRCKYCLRLVTEGRIKFYGRCVCGSQRVVATYRLSILERLLCKIGFYPLTLMERNYFRPFFDFGGTWETRKVRAKESMER